MKTIKIEDLEIMLIDLEDEYTWYQAKSECAKIGFRLPTIDELSILFKNRENIGGFSEELYWSSNAGSELEFRSHAFCMSMGPQGGTAGETDRDNYCLVRPVKSV